MSATQDRSADENVGIDASNTESTPLLSPSRRSRRRTKDRRISIGAIIALTLISLIGAICGFILPHMAQSYVEQALDYELGSIELERVTHLGADVRVTGEIYLNASKVDNQGARRLTDFLLHLVGPIPVSHNALKVNLLSDGSHRIAETLLDDLKLDLAYQRRNAFDMTTSVQFANVDVIGKVARDILMGDRRTIALQATVSSTVKKIVQISKEVTRAIDYELPRNVAEVPQYNITRLSIQDMPVAGIKAEAAAELFFYSPISAFLPSIELRAGIKGCNDELIYIATGSNAPFRAEGGSRIISIEASGNCEQIPAAALHVCDELKQSPIDTAMQSFLAGNTTTVYLTGVQETHNSWLQRMLREITIPIQIPGSQSQQFARDIVLSDVKFNLPSFFGGGGKPKISGKVRGTIDIPADISVGIKVDSVHVLADLIYKGKKFAYVESPGWAPATSRAPTKEELLVEVALKDAPVTITDDDIFSNVVSSLLGGNVLVDVMGTGDVKVLTSLGKVEAHKLPIEAKDIEIGGLGFMQGLQPKITALNVLSTSSEHMEIMAEAEINNPTQYKVAASYLDVLLTYHNHTIGNITVDDMSLTDGVNKLRARLRYAPYLFPDGHANSKAGSELLGTYLSEVPVNVTLKAHKDSIPDYPNLSRALAHLPLQVSLPVPRIVPKDDKDDGGDGDDKERKGGSSQFLVAAKFHVFSSTASFILRNPLDESITITDLHATALYHDDVVGVLDYAYPILLADSPQTETTRLPVTWRLPPSDILRKAVSGTLRVNATASAKVTIGKMSGIPIRLTLSEVGAGIGI